MTTTEGGDSNDIQSVYSDATSGEFQLAYNAMTTSLMSFDIGAGQFLVELKDSLAKAM